MITMRKLKKPRLVGRDARTGRFIPLEAARRRKSTATVEKIRPTAARRRP